MPGDNKNYGRNDVNNLTKADSLHKKGEHNNDNSNKKNKDNRDDRLERADSSNSNKNLNDNSKRNNNVSNNSSTSQNNNSNNLKKSNNIGNSLINKTPAGKGLSLANKKIKGLKPPNSNNRNIGKSNLNDNTDIAQPSKSKLDKEKEKNNSRLPEQLQKNIARGINSIHDKRSNTKNGGLSGITNKKENNTKDKKSDTKNSKGMTKLKGWISKKVIKYVALVSVFAFGFILIISIPVMAANKFLTLIGIDSTNNKEEMKAATSGDSDLEILYTNISEVQKEYQSNGKSFSADIIGAIYHILSTRTTTFKPYDMTKELIREIADNLFDESCDENGENCTFNYNESTARSYLQNVLFPRYLDKKESIEAVDEVFSYIEEYKTYFKNSTTGGSVCAISGDTQSSVFLTATQEEFLNIIGPIANQAYSQTGIFASVTIAQAIIEAGWGKHTPTADSNNLFGIKCSKTILTPSTWDGSCTEPVFTKEHTSSGSVYTIKSSFKKFKNVEEAILDHSALLVSGGTYVRHGVAQATNPYEQIKRIKEAGYATDVNYVSKITDQIKRYNLEQWDITSSSSCVSSGGDYTTWRQKDSKWSSINLGNTKETIGEEA